MGGFMITNIYYYNACVCVCVRHKIAQLSISDTAGESRRLRKRLRGGKVRYYADTDEKWHLVDIYNTAVSYLTYLHLS